MEVTNLLGGQFLNECMVNADLEFGRANDKHFFFLVLEKIICEQMLLNKLVGQGYLRLKFNFLTLLFEGFLPLLNFSVLVLISVYIPVVVIVLVWNHDRSGLLFEFLRQCDCLIVVILLTEVFLKCFQYILTEFTVWMGIIVKRIKTQCPLKIFNTNQ